MKEVLGIALVAALAAAPSAAQTKAAKPAHRASETQTISRIRGYRHEVEQKLVDGKLRRSTIVFKGKAVKESITQKWEKMDAYFQGQEPVRIQLYPHPGISERSEEFYLRNRKLVFAFIQDKGPKHEGKDTGEAGKELYFQDGRLIDLKDRSGEPEKRPKLERRMYETLLPYEVDELLDLLNHDHGST